MQRRELLCVCFPPHATMSGMLLYSLLHGSFATAGLMPRQTMRLSWRHVWHRFCTLLEAVMPTDTAALSNPQGRPDLLLAHTTCACSF